MIIEQILVTGMAVFCYLLVDEKTDSKKVRYLLEEVRKHLERPDHYITEKDQKPPDKTNELPVKKEEKEIRQRDLFEF